MLITFAGFDFADPSQSTEWIGSAPGRNTTARTGLRSADVGGNSLNRLLGNLATVIVGGALRATAITNTMIRFMDGASEHVTIGVASDFSIVVRRGSGSGTIIAQSAAGIFPLSSWNYIEVKLTINDSTGAVEVRLNGGTKINVSAIDTKNTANAFTTELRMGGGGGGTFLLDDFYICDTTGGVNNDFLGDVRVETLFPNGAGTYTEWDPSAGSNFQNVDDNPTPDDDTTNNSTGTVNDRDLYSLSNLVMTSGAIPGVRAHMRARKDDAGTREAAIMIRSNTTEVTETTQSLGLNYLQYDGPVKEVDPATSAAWTVSGVNVLEAGAKLIS